MKTISGFHAHVYFVPETRDSAMRLQTQLQAIRPPLYVSRLVDRPIGPHPVPMFELDFSPERFAEVVPWLMLHHGAHSVLIHPLTGSDHADHFEHALWLGPSMRLDASQLDD